MMFAWSFAARTPDEVGRLVRALGRHRYLKEADLRLHFAQLRRPAVEERFQESHEAGMVLRRRLAGAQEFAAFILAGEESIVPAMDRFRFDKERQLAKQAAAAR